MQTTLPQHIAIIPDGNRRWAQSHYLDPWEGHAAGLEAATLLAKHAFKSGVINVSFWGSSISNLKSRSAQEVKGLLKVYQQGFKTLLRDKDLDEQQVEVKILGEWKNYLPGPLRLLGRKVLGRTVRDPQFRLNLLLAYDGAREMITGFNEILASGVKKVTPEMIKQHLWTRDLPAVDLVIRTGVQGDPHNSAGFMMWDTQDAQYYFSDKFFPDFGEEDLSKALTDYQRRQRRLGA